MAKLASMMAKLKKLEGAVEGNYDPHSDVLTSPSPSFNFAFGNGWGLPKGFTLCLFGEPKSGKSLITYAMAGQLHRDDPEAVVIRFDTELRETGQLNPQMQQMWGIDPERYLCYSVNSPDLIFDRIEKDIAAMCQEGLKVGMIIIDSLSGIQGRRAMSAESVMNFQIGDDAMTLQIGLKRIMPVIRKYKIGLALTAHVRAEMDQTEVMRGNKFRMAAAFGVKHTAEYFMFVEQLRTKDSRKDALGKEFIDNSVSDMNDNGEKTAHKLRFTMKDSSLGPKGRAGICTLSYRDGIINTHEEVFFLGKNRGLFTGSAAWIEYDGQKYNGKAAMLEELRKNPDLCAKILKELRRRDLGGEFIETPKTVSDETSDEE